MTNRADFHRRDVRVYQPFAAELPVDIVGPAADPRDVRVAKLRDRVVGGYWLVRTSAEGFAIRALGVYADYRHRSIGRWLVGHALGIAESRGGRVVEAPAGASGFFLKQGFSEHAGGPRFVLTPE